MLPVLLWVVVIGPLLLYPLARWKANREHSVDNQLGLKVALHHFHMMAFQIVLLGALIVVWTVISKGEGKGDLYRVGFAFLVSGGIVLGVHGVLLKRTNDEVFPNVRRLFLGYNLIITGIFGFAAIVLAFQALFAKGSSGNEGRMFFAGLLVYGGAWVACGLHFARVVFGDQGGSSQYPLDHVVPPPPPAQPGAQSTPGLPPLSSGAYPPIEPK